MSSHITRAATALLAAGMTLSLLATTALAATPGPSSEDVTFAERGITAQGYSETCDGPDADGITRCEGTQAFIFAGRQRSDDEFGHANGPLTYLCIYTYRAAYGEDGMPVEPPIVEQGCADDPQLVAVDTLESLTASVGALELTEMLCTYDPETGGEWCELGDSRFVPVEAVFTGIGEISSDRWNSKSRSVVDGARCTFSSSGSGIRRDATASITIDGTASGPVFGQLSDGKTRFAQRCS